MLPGVHVKMVLQWPAAVLSGQVVDTSVSALDLLPTIVQAARGSASPEVSSLDSRHGSLDGLSLLPLLQPPGSRTHMTSAPPTQSSQHQNRVLYWRFNATCHRPKRALLQGSFKWLNTGAGSNAGTVHRLLFSHLARIGELTLVTEVVNSCLCGSCVVLAGGELYDLSVDVNETRDLASRHPGLAGALAKLHSTWERTLPPLYVTAATQATRTRECAKRQQMSTGGRTKVLSV